MGQGKLILVQQPIVRVAGVRSIGVIGDPGCEGLGTYNMKIYAERRNTLVNGFREMGFDVKMPRGTFYVWFDTGMTSLEFTEKCLEAGVVCTPGSGFGASAEGYVRFAITQPVERTKEALARLKEIL